MPCGKFNFSNKISPNCLGEEIVKTYNELLEKYIRMYPDEWVWMHKRWRVVNGKDLSRREYLEHLNNLLTEKKDN